MKTKLRFLTAVFSAAALVAATNPALAQDKDKTKGHGNPHQQQQNQQKPDHGPGSAKVKGHKHVSGKNLLGDKIKKNGEHKLQDHDKFSAYADVSNGKVTGVKVKHADRGDVPVTKYKSSKQMAMAVRGDGTYLAQYGQVVTLWIGYAYIDDWGEEIIYWFPVDVVLDGDMGAIDYVDVEYYG
jgi:hypothetical protein